MIKGNYRGGKYKEEGGVQDLFVMYVYYDHLVLVKWDFIIEKQLPRSIMKYTKSLY